MSPEELIERQSEFEFQELDEDAQSNMIGYLIQSTHERLSKVENSYEYHERVGANASILSDIREDADLLENSLLFLNELYRKYIEQYYIGEAESDSDDREDPEPRGDESDEGKESVEATSGEEVDDGETPGESGEDLSDDFDIPKVRSVEDLTDEERKKLGIDAREDSKGEQAGASEAS